MSSYLSLLPAAVLSLKEHHHSWRPAIHSLFILSIHESNSPLPQWETWTHEVKPITWLFTFISSVFNKQGCFRYKLSNKTTVGPTSSHSAVSYEWLSGLFVCHSAGPPLWSRLNTPTNVGCIAVKIHADIVMTLVSPNFSSSGIVRLELIFTNTWINSQIPAKLKALSLASGKNCVKC